MKRAIFALPVAALMLSAVPAVAKTHKDNFTVPCATLWPAIKDVLRNSGKYGIISITNDEMTASYNIGGALTGKRVNSVLLNTIPSGCEMQIQTAYSGFVNNDASDFKSRVDASLAKLKDAPPADAKPEAKPDAPPTPTKELILITLLSPGAPSMQHHRDGRGTTAGNPSLRLSRPNPPVQSPHGTRNRPAPGLCRVSPRPGHPRPLPPRRPPRPRSPLPPCSPSSHPHRSPPPHQPRDRLQHLPARPQPLHPSSLIAPAVPWTPVPSPSPRPETLLPESSTSPRAPLQKPSSHRAPAFSRSPSPNLSPSTS